MSFRPSKNACCLPGERGQSAFEAFHKALCLRLGGLRLFGLNPAGILDSPTCRPVGHDVGESGRLPRFTCYGHHVGNLQKGKFGTVPGPSISLNVFVGPVSCAGSRSRWPGFGRLEALELKTSQSSSRSSHCPSRTGL